MSESKRAVAAGGASKGFDSGSLYVAASAVCFAIGGILIKINSWSGVTINGSRCCFTLLVMFFYLRFLHRRIVLNAGTLICAAANFSMGLSFVVANKMTSAANAIVLQFTMPVFIIIFLWIFFKQRPDKLAVSCCFLSFVGIAFFFFDSLTPDGMIGNLLAILSGALYGVVFISKKIKGCDFESGIFWSCVMSMIVSMPSMIRELSFQPVNILSVMGLGIIQLGISYILLSKGLETVSPVGASLLSMIEPILNPILVAVFYGEMIGKYAFVGAAIVLISAVIYNVVTASRTHEN